VRSSCDGGRDEALARGVELAELALHVVERDGELGRARQVRVDDEAPREVAAALRPGGASRR
jgi:hypothetical protein